MRTLAITQNMTLDGCVEMLDSWSDPTVEFDPTADNTELVAENRRHQDRCDAVLLGRQTFEDFRGFWPNQTGEVADFLDRVDKYVVTGTLTDPGWQNTHLIGTDDPVAAIRELKEQPGSDIVVTGSITLCHSLIRAGLVDEYRLFGYPVVQGRGRRLFPDGFTLPRMALRDMKSFPGGITYTCHTPS
ncbi:MULTISPECIES: dihydrofolate reductase family protein [Prauserella salsuginis group]|uniref:Dihydrofolate reductase n=2 Tax=Prauserella salsuginis group TaxID=2893672 RepID=A0A839XFY6_9PSEU|nr:MULTISPECIES: dihydrofolate reductase family protein [Prauserella salsuginis group]MBB3662872.1 dihydrofolate reductase [Prauserella sediminis]MCR3720569.1 RibD C-terminal domain-containing protein [Prauserella flava]MCR3733721.1 RibD C-terminal domain-containing protein [Prauserella salsuginis]